MVERLPKLFRIHSHEISDEISFITLEFDSVMSEANIAELEEHIKLKFAGQLRRDPDAPQTPPPPPESGL
jgi:hypothetical protein